MHCVYIIVQLIVLRISAHHKIAMAVIHSSPMLPEQVARRNLINVFFRVMDGKVCI